MHLVEGEIALGGEGPEHGDSLCGPHAALVWDTLPRIPGRCMSPACVCVSVCASDEMAVLQEQASSSGERQGSPDKSCPLVEAPGRRSPWTAPPLADRGFRQHLCYQGPLRARKRHPDPCGPALPHGALFLQTLAELEGPAHIQAAP